MAKIYLQKVKGSNFLLDNASPPLELGRITAIKRVLLPSTGPPKIFTFGENLS